ncbi:MAG: pyruvate, phosphate dikinase [Actinobacteria bacterium]|nr:pyruvate, phosphate dikinase [Actinomycetota bacterium]MCL6105167.1 pyruvate, phosphate dikinase [Actinomycetota bacterium]
MQYVFDFDYKHATPPKELKGLLGGKGANLAEMTSVLGLPVPNGFTITTDACRAYMESGWPKGLTQEVIEAQQHLEHSMSRRIGDPDNPLLVSVRSGAKFSMPGMMDTVLNLGLNDKSVLGLAKQTSDDRRFAFDSYRRFIQMYSRIVLNLPVDRFEDLLKEAKKKANTTSDAGIPADVLEELVESYKSLVQELYGSPFPLDPALQLRQAIEAVFSSWNADRAKAYRAKEGIPDDLGTAVNVQAMVFGNRDDNSGTGVGFTRDPATGAKGAYGDFLPNAQGEDVVAGIRNTQPLSALESYFPEVYQQLMDIFKRLETHYRDMCDTEFTVEQGKLWMLQTRVGKRTGVAALKMAVDMVEDSHIKLSKQEAVMRINADNLDQVLHPQLDKAGGSLPQHGERVLLVEGLPASPGAAVGKVYFSADSAVSAAADGEKVILVRSETSPDDVHGMLASQGILTSRGGLVSHAAVVARGWGKPAVVGAEAIHITGDSFSVRGVVSVEQVGGNNPGVISQDLPERSITVKQGDFISIDGTTGEVFLGELPLVQSQPPSEFYTILSWADEIRKDKLGVRANADTAADARKARELGAEGIGLCRTEHMFLAQDRLPVVRRMILANTPAEESEALDELEKVQKEDFLGILEAMDSLPVTVRLLDPPLHEFLPDVESLAVKEATEGLTEEEYRWYEAAQDWREENPMLGTRGVRLGVVKPGLYAMQVKALMEAVLQRFAQGGKPIVEVMIPLVVSREELQLARGWTKDAIDEVVGTDETGFKVNDEAVKIGTMIETPRAALVADQIAQEADFFSFGTNDLTQMTFGFSRDDVEGKLMPHYIKLGLLENNPFETVDLYGVGELVRIAIQRGRKSNTGLKIGVCGEHGGDPRSIKLFFDAGVDYVSCSPFRVPIARLSAAQAVLEKQSIVTGP